jgi:hypothetical protein
MHIDSAAGGAEKEFFSGSTEKTWQQRRSRAKLADRVKAGRGGYCSPLGRRPTTGQLNNDNHRHEGKRDGASCRYSWAEPERHSADGSYQPKGYKTGQLTGPFIGSALGETSRTSHKKADQL